MQICKDTLQPCAIICKCSVQIPWTFGSRLRHVDLAHAEWLAITVARPVNFANMTP